MCIIMLSIEAYRASIGGFYNRLRYPRKVNTGQFDYKYFRELYSWVFFTVCFLCCIVFYVVFLNLHYSLVKAGNLTREGVESNPGPRNFVISKVIRDMVNLLEDNAQLMPTSLSFFQQSKM